jgi:hypothetical protein
LQEVESVASQNSGKCYVSVSELNSLKKLSNTQKKEGEGKLKKKKIVRVDNDLFTPSPTLAKTPDRILFLCERDMMTYEEWLEIEVESFLNFADENKRLDANASLSDFQTGNQRYAKALRASNREMMKAVFFLGRSVFFMRTRQDLMWDEVLGSIKPSLSRTTLYGYEKIYVFVNKYPRFLRVTIGHSVLLKAIKPLEIFFSHNHAVAGVWTDLYSE